MIRQTETKPDADGDFSNAPIFNFNDDKVKFDTKYVDNANDNYGSASWFSPKSLFFLKGVIYWRLSSTFANASNLRASFLFRLYVFE